MTLWVLLSILSASPASPPEPGDQAATRMPHCGVAAVYATAQLLSVSADPVEIENSILEAEPAADLGALSLRQISDAFARIGLSATPKQCSPEESVHLRTPFVAYYLPERLGGPETWAGHVVVVTRISRDRVRILDLTESAEPIQVAFSEFKDTWDGHYIEVTAGNMWATQTFVRIVLIFVAVVSCVAFCWSLSRQGRGRGVDTSVGVV